MKLAANRLPKTPAARREQLLEERAQAATLRKTFPHIGQLRIDLAFSDTSGRSPSAQSHTLYPAASAFFRFPCACADCDGDFDLTLAVAALVKAKSGTAHGQLVCNGTRRDRPPESPACSIRLSYQLTAHPVTGTTEPSGPSRK